MAGQAGLVGMWMSCKTDNGQLDTGLTIGILYNISVDIGRNTFVTLKNFLIFFILFITDINYEQFIVVIPIVFCSKTTIGNIS